MGEHRTETILVTSSVIPANVEFLSIRDPSERLRQTVAGLLCWFDQPSVRAVVFCDNSGVELDVMPLVRLAEAKGVEFESIVFNDNVIARTSGKGAGEGRILDRAMDESHVLTRCKTFWKCTGKFFVVNFSEIAASHEFNDVVFTRPGWSHLAPFEPKRLGLLRACHAWIKSRTVRLAKRSLYGFDPELNVNTQFWKSSVEFFNRVLRRRYTEVNDRRRFFIEHVYAQAMVGMSIVTCKPAPLLVGRSGSIHATYGGGIPPEMLDEADRLIAKCRR